MQRLDLYLWLLRLERHLRDQRRQLAVWKRREDLLLLSGLHAGRVRLFARARARRGTLRVQRAIVRLGVLRFHHRAVRAARAARQLHLRHRRSVVPFVQQLGKLQAGHVLVVRHGLRLVLRRRRLL